MNRLFWGIALLVSVAAGGWAQSTWRGQAEVWATSDAPSEGYVAASNEFPKNSLLSIENYKSRKTIQVRVVAVLPSGSSALVLLNGKAAQALDIKSGEIPLVGVRLEPSGIERADNPDPDVNPLANKPASAMAEAPAPSAVTPAVASVPAVPAPAAEPVVAPAAPEPARTPTTSLDVARASTSLDPAPAPLPLPALADSGVSEPAVAAAEPAAEPAVEPAAAVEPVPAPEIAAEPERTPLAVSGETEPETPVTPGRKVFVTTSDPEPAETPLVDLSVPDAPVAEAPVSEPIAAAPEPIPPTPTSAPVAVVPEPEPTPAPAVVSAAPVAESAPVTAPTPVAAPVAAPVVAPAASISAPAKVAVVPAKPAPDAWVAAPGKLEGPVLGTVSLLPTLEKGRSYVQIGAWATEADVLAALGSVTSYVPLALYRAEGEKNPWRVVVAGAPKGQLGLLLMHYRSQGFRSAAVVKG